MDYNVFYQKPYLGYLCIGLRYGMSSFTYDASGPDMTDPNYGGHITAFADLGVKSNASWLEESCGIKVKIYTSVSMGWAVRYKMRMSVGLTKTLTHGMFPVSVKRWKQLQSDV